MTTMRSNSRYAEYAVVILVIVIGLLGVLNFSGILHLTAEAVIGAILATFGIFTLTYIAVKLSSFEKNTRNYFIVWGYISAALGIVLILAPVVNILLALSVAVIGLAVIVLLIIRLSK